MQHLGVLTSAGGAWVFVGDQKLAHNNVGYLWEHLSDWVWGMGNEALPVLKSIFQSWSDSIPLLSSITRTARVS